MIAAVAAVATLAGAPAGAYAQPHTVRVRVDAHAIHAPRTIRPGLTTIAATVRTPGTSSLAVARLRPGVSIRAVRRAAAAGNLAEVFRRVTAQGGLAHIGPTTGHSWTTRLRPGRYVFVDDEAGLFAPLRVRGAARPAATPRRDGTVAFARAAIQLPHGFGDGTWKFVNHDTVARELGIIRIDGGHSPAEALAAATGGDRPDWLTPVGTLNAISPGQTAWYTVRGLHGDYLLLDYLPALQGAAPAPLVVFHHFT
jgi:hypothetical protein